MSPVCYFEESRVAISCWVYWVYKKRLSDFVNLSHIFLAVFVIAKLLLVPLAVGSNFVGRVHKEVKSLGVLKRRLIPGFP